MSEHTPGPWEVVEASIHHGFYIDGGAGFSVCDLYFLNGKTGVQHFENAEANARRIVACVNALEGQPTELIEDATITVPGVSYRMLVEALLKIQQRAADNLDDRETVHAVHAIATAALTPDVACL